MADTSLFLQQLLTLPTVDYALLSPDGRWVAFTWYRKHANLDVFLVPTDGSHAPVALTHTGEATELVSWTSDSLAVIVSEDHDGDERSCLFLVNINSPGVMQPLTEDRPPFYIRGGDLHPNGRYLFYGANYDFKRAEEIEPTWVYRHDLSTGERLPIACPGKPNWFQPMLSRDGTALIYTRKDLHPAGRQIYLVDSDGKNDREILNFGDQVKVFARWFPDNQNILFLCESTGDKSREYIRLGVYHFPSQSIRWLVDDPGRTIDRRTTATPQCGTPSGWNPSRLPMPTPSLPLNGTLLLNPVTLISSRSPTALSRPARNPASHQRFPSPGRSCSPRSVTSSLGTEQARSGRPDGNRDFVGVRVVAQTSLAEKIGLNVNAGIQWGDFDTPNPAFGVERKDTLFDVVLQVSYLLADKWSVQPQLLWIKNDSNLAITDSERTDISIQLRRDFW